MQFVPLIAGVVASAALAPALRRGLAGGGHLRMNYRGTQLPCPFGLLIALAIILGASITALASLSDENVHLPPLALAFVLGVAFLGLVDDQFTTASRGLRGHLRAVVRGELSTGALKAVGTLALALVFVTDDVLLDEAAFIDDVLVVAILVLGTNLFNLLDLRPGRSVKAFVIVVLACVPFIDVNVLDGYAVLVGPVLVAGLYDLRERAMLGDTGSNAVGAIAGLFAVLAAGDSTAALAAIAAVLLLITLYGELRSINALVESTPGLKHLDSLGRPA